MTVHRRPTAPAPGAPALDRSVLERLVADLGGEPGLIAELAAVFLRELPVRRRALLAALDAGDAPAQRACAHALRSPSLMLGLARLDHVCRAIEQAAAGGAAQLPAGALRAEFLAACAGAAVAIGTLAAVSLAA